MSDVSYLLVAEDTQHGGFVVFVVREGQVWDVAAWRAGRSASAVQRIMRYSELVALSQEVGTTQFRGAFKLLPGYPSEESARTTSGDATGSPR